MGTLAGLLPLTVGLPMRGLSGCSFKEDAPDVEELADDRRMCPDDPEGAGEHSIEEVGVLRGVLRHELPSVNWLP